MDRHSKDYINKVILWLNTKYEEDYDHEYIIKILFDKVLNFINTNKLKLSCNNDDFYDYFVNYVYKYSLHKSYINYSF